MNKYAKVFRSNNFLILNKDFLTLLNDLNTAVYLSYLIDKYVYFSTNNMITYFDNQEYFFNLQKDIEDEIYLSPKQQRTCLDNLQKINIVKTKLKGIPAKTFFHIDFDLLFELFSNLENTSNKEIEQQDVTKGNNNNSQNVIHITNNKELITKNNIKNKEIYKTNELVLQNQQSINNVFNDIFDLSVRYDFNNIENETKLNDILKSNKMNEVKKMYNEIARNNLFKGKTYDNIMNWHKNNLKVNCLTSVWLYDYEILKFRMKYNADYFLKTIYDIDRYLQDPTHFKKYTDHYQFIENWIKRDIGKIIEINTHIRVDRYKYLNYGVDYDLFK
jgi:hypothetical protein